MSPYIEGMRQLAITTATCLCLATGAMAQDSDRGLSLMERGAQLFLEGILKEMEPALQEFENLADDIGPALQNFARDMGPALTELLQQVEDWSLYAPPEVLPNGDIIIRRKPQAPDQKSPDPQVAPPASEMPQIDL